MSWKVLVTALPMEKTGEHALALLHSAGCQTVLKPRFGYSTQALLDLLDGADAVLAGADQYSATVLQSPAAARLKIISRWGVGYDAIDVAAATARGIVIAYTPGLTDDAVADYTFALLLALTRRVVDGCLTMREGLWLPHWGSDLAGKTIGILGFGRIGRAVAQRARGFSLRVIAHDPSLKPAEADTGVELVSLDELLVQSDFLTLHATLTPQNRGLIGEAQLRRMKPSARIINAARGPLIDEAALFRALCEGWIAGAALDVFAEEPLPPHHPLHSAPNLLLSPHQASSSLETGERISQAAAQAIIDLMNGGRPVHVVNPEVFPSLNHTKAI
jgi:phosphoglycerate dehydrogenase-like enzyme